MNIGVVAGEISGDRLAAGLLRALAARTSELRAAGAAGEAMAAAGCRVLVPAARLAVMGVSEVAVRLPDLVAVRRRLARHFIAERPAVFIGVDAPDFNLGLEARLRRAGVPTVHYVSPTVWAWREGRVATIRRAADLVLTLFPFEEEFYRVHGVPARFVGHPLADVIPERTDRHAARRALGLAGDGPLLALLPGSRAGELAQHLEPFLATAAWCRARLAGLTVALAAADAHCEARARQAAAGCGFPLAIFRSRAREVIGAADAVLLASGTAAVETMLVKRPMVVAYRMSWPSYALIRPQVRVPYCSMVNVLAGRRLVPEFLQGEVRPENMGAELLPWLERSRSPAALEGEFAELHRRLRVGDAYGRAADAVLELVHRAA